MARAQKFNRTPPSLSRAEWSWSVETGAPPFFEADFSAVPYTAENRKKTEAMGKSYDPIEVALRNLNHLERLGILTQGRVDHTPKGEVYDRYDIVKDDDKRTIRVTGSDNGRRLSEWAGKNNPVLHEQLKAAKEQWLDKVLGKQVVPDAQPEATRERQPRLHIDYLEWIPEHGEKGGITVRGRVKERLPKQETDDHIYGAAKYFYQEGRLKPELKGSDERRDGYRRFVEQPNKNKEPLLVFRDHANIRAICRLIGRDHPHLVESVQRMGVDFGNVALEAMKKNSVIIEPASSAQAAEPKPQGHAAGELRRRKKLNDNDLQPGLPGIDIVDRSAVALAILAEGGHESRAKSSSRRCRNPTQNER